MVAHLIGFDIPLVLDMEMIGPGEGEVVAARRLIERLVACHARFFDAVLADALYLEGPLFNLCIEQGKHVLAVLKENNPALLTEARALLQGAPDWGGSQQDRRNQRQVRLWDQEGFARENIQVPLRLVRSEENWTQRKRIGRQWVVEEKQSEWFWATTIPQELIPARQLRQIGHERWSIENRVFNALGAHWGLNHCFHHDPAAIENFLLILFIAHALLSCFARRNLKGALGRLTLLDVARRLLIGLGSLSPHWRAPWLAPRQHLPP